MANNIELTTEAILLILRYAIEDDLLPLVEALSNELVRLQSEFEVYCGKCKVSKGLWCHCVVCGEELTTTK